MSLGHRIRHRSLRSCLVTVGLVDTPFRRKGNPIPEGKGCAVCGTRHLVKTYHLNLDSDGTCIVSEVIFDNLRRVGAIEGSPGGGPAVAVPSADFLYVNEVTNPPPINVGFDRGRPQVIQQRQHIHVDYGGHDG